jgi:hypothetical protein
MIVNTEYADISLSSSPMQTLVAAQFAFRGEGEYAKTRTEKAHLAHDGCRCSGSPAAGGLKGSSSLEENFTKRIDFQTNFLAAVTLSTSMKHLKVENNHRGAFRIRARTPPKG